MPVYRHFSTKKMLEMQGHKIDQTQKIPEMPGMLGMQPAGHKKVQKAMILLIFPKINNQKPVLATPLKYPRNRLHDNAGDVSQ